MTRRPRPAAPAADAPKPRPTVAWAPQPGPQTAYVTSPIFETVYGGARGGGKTDGSLGDWAIHAARHGPNAIGLFVRRTRVALEPTIERARQLFAGLGVYQEQKSRFVMATGAVLYFRHLDRDADADAFQGHSYTRVYVEELTQFRDPRPVEKLKATLRSAAGVPVGFRATCNPGGPGHTWVKARYIDPGPWRRVDETFRDPFTGDLAVTSRVFIPARLSDNPELLRNDPGYVGRLYLAGSSALVKAWLEGDWDVIEGAFFDGWSAARNTCRPFAVPADWTRFRSFDWGSARPFSVGWWAIAPDPVVTAEGVRVPRGCLVRYREWYGMGGRPNEGLKLTAEQVAQGIVAREQPGEAIAYSVADPAIFAEDGGPSIAERMWKEGVAFRRADNARVARDGAVGGWDQMRARIQGWAAPPDSEGGTDERTALTRAAAAAALDEGAMLVVFDTCRDFIRTVPVLQHDPARPEDLDTEAEDHAADEARYACMSRPWSRRIDPPAKPRVPKTLAEMTGDDFHALMDRRMETWG